MALKDKNVLTASTGFIYVGSPGLAFPTPTEIDDFDAVTFGSISYNLLITASSGTIKLKVGSTPTDTADIAFDADAATIQTALEAHSGIGEGNVLVEDEGTPKTFIVTFIGSLQGVDPVLAAGASGSTVTTDTALNGWTMVGHTSREDLPEFGSEGGDKEVKGTWQIQNLKEVETEALAEYMTMVINQIDRTSFTLYHGPSSTPSVPGVFGVSGNAASVEKALLVVIVDGDVKLGWACPKASFRREDSLSLATDDFAGIPVRATFLKFGARDLYRWISNDLFD